MSNEKNPITSAFHNFMKNDGFTKRGSTWYRDNHEVAEVMNLQRSRFGPQYYINYALWLKFLGDPQLPKEVDCHIRMRESNFGGDAARVHALLDLNSDIPIEDRSRGIEQFLLQSFKPFAEGCRNLDGIRLHFRNGRLANTLIVTSARELLSRS